MRKGLSPSNLKSIRKSEFEVRNVSLKKSTKDFVGRTNFQILQKLIRSKSIGKIPYVMDFKKNILLLIFKERSKVDHLLRLLKLLNIYFYLLMI